MAKIVDKRRQLIYECASEAVMDVRLTLKRICEKYRISPEFEEELDIILSKAQHNAGDFAIRAAEADLRDVARWQQLIFPEDRQCTEHYKDTHDRIAKDRTAADQTGENSRNSGES